MMMPSNRRRPIARGDIAAAALNHSAYFHRRVRREFISAASLRVIEVRLLAK